jgi:phage shock protein A
MALINRITRLFRADMHAVLDRIEEPEALLKQSIREMEAAIEQDQLQLKNLQYENTQTNDRLQEIDRSQQQLSNELEICFKHQNEVLARKIIRRQLEAQRYAQLLTDKQEKFKTNMNNIQSRLNENQIRLETIKQKLDMLSIHVSHTEGNDVYATDIAIHDDEVEIAFLHEKQQRSQHEK